MMNEAGSSSGVALAAAVTLTILSAVSCSQGLVDGQTREVVVGGGDAPTVKVSNVLPTDVSVLDHLTVTVDPAEGGYDVVLSAAADLTSYTELFLRVEFDPNILRQHGLQDHLGSLRPDTATLAVPVAAGTIDYGAVIVGQGLSADNADARTGALAGDRLLSFKLIPGAAERTPSAVASSNRARARNLSLSELGDGSWELSWDYTNPGDNNQDGVVSIQDLTPIGRNYQAKVNNNWDDPLRHIDGNGDGEVNMPDITAIGQNYSAEIFAYQIEMSQDGDGSFITVGQLLLGDQSIDPGVTYRFYYTFAAQYVAGAWYRVVALDKNLVFGPPSEAISETGRRIDEAAVPAGDAVTVTVTANGLERSIAYMNSVRVVYPASYTYVTDSFNVGTSGGSRDYPDGIWASFAEGLLLPPEVLLIETDLADDRKAIDFNITKITGSLPSAPVNYGDLFNFKLESASGDPLTLEFQDISGDGIKRTYYAESDTTEHFFGNTIGWRIL